MSSTFYVVRLRRLRRCQNRVMLPYQCVNNSCAKFIFAGNRRIALKNSTQTLYYNPDHLGGTSVVTDASGNKVEDISYYPFGETRQDSGNVKVSHKFTGQENDAETGLYNYGARLYDPVLGRFLTPDSIVSDPENPQSFNRYAYALNNPVNLIDPTGHEDCYFDDCGSGLLTSLFGFSELFTSGANIYNAPDMDEIVVFGTKLNEADSPAPTFEAIEGVELATYSMAPLFDPFDFIGPGELKLAGGLLVGGGIKLLGKEAVEIGGEKITNYSIGFAQKSISSTFRHGEFAGQTLKDVANKLINGTINPNQLPIQTITRNGITYTLNNRSLMALNVAGMNPTVIRDVTGNPFFENLLTERLIEIGGEISSNFVPRIRGGL